jgi:hypothetical protein
MTGKEEADCSLLVNSVVVCKTDKTSMAVPASSFPESVLFVV